MASGKRYLLIGAIILVAAALIIGFSMWFYSGAMLNAPISMDESMSETMALPSTKSPTVPPPPSAPPAAQPLKTPETQLGGDVSRGIGRSLDDLGAVISPVPQAPSAQVPAAKNGDIAMAPPPPVSKISKAPDVPLNGDVSRERSRLPAGAGVLSLPSLSELATDSRVMTNESQIDASGMAILRDSPPAAANGADNGVEETMERSLASMATAAGETTAGRLDKYKVELGVTEEMYKPGPLGELKVWIGDPKLSAEFTEDMATAETTVLALGQFASVMPFAPDFEVKPDKSMCVKIHPSGTDVRFSLKPKGAGTFKVSAEVLLYTSEGCQGSPVSKSADPLEVEVKVDYLHQLWEILWQGILDFWKWLIAAIAGLFVFLIRKRLKKWFGYDAPESG